jgi:Flagellar biosynthesis protein, FliO
MVQAWRRRWLRFRGFAACALMAAGVAAVTAGSRRALAFEDPGVAPAASQPTGTRAPESAPIGHDDEPRASRGRDVDSRSSRSVIARRLSSAARGSSSDGWYWGMAGITLALALCGGLVASARRFFPQGAGAGVQIVSRVSLSPKHAVYVLRIGRRVLLVGSGPQGPPALISELDDASETEPGRRPGDEP